VLAWLQNNKEAILKAERDFRVDRRAIAGAIAWEAMEKCHARQSAHRRARQDAHHKNASASVLPCRRTLRFRSNSRSLASCPKPKDDADREAIMRMPQGSITYRGRDARRCRYRRETRLRDFHELGALTSFYQGHDLPSWEKHMAEKQRKEGDGVHCRRPHGEVDAEHVVYLKPHSGSPIYWRIAQR
jgi:hypothetical protein